MSFGEFQFPDHTERDQCLVCGRYEDEHTAEELDRCHEALSHE